VFATVAPRVGIPESYAIAFIQSISIGLPRVDVMAATTAIVGVAAVLLVACAAYLLGVSIIASARRRDDRSARGSSIPHDFRER
jgi:hypothetical protein